MMRMKHVMGVAVAACTVTIMAGCVHGNGSGAIAAEKAERDSSYDKPGFYTALDAKDGRLWVFAKDSEDLAKFKAEGNPARHVLRPGAGPDGLTLKSTESSTIIEYVATRPGFFVSLDPRDERLWVFEEGSEDLAKFKSEGRPARHVLRPGAGPLGLTLKSTEFDVLDAYQAAK